MVKNKGSVGNIPGCTVLFCGAWHTFQKHVPLIFFNCEYLFIYYLLFIYVVEVRDWSSKCKYTYKEIVKGLDFDDMSSFFPCEIDDAIQYINL